MAFKESNEKIESFLKENELYPLHLINYLQANHETVCRDKSEDDELMNELDEFRNSN